MNAFVTQTLLLTARRDALADDSIAPSGVASNDLSDLPAGVLFLSFSAVPGGWVCSVSIAGFPGAGVVGVGAGLTRGAAYDALENVLSFPSWISEADFEALTLEEAENPR